ncbi:MAG TPA: hypothetical protein VFS08_09085 [Gemmatimonadaceae bacterium]|nr:hypothetical protein [Gemmatimonadaceae bacterium]
MTMRHHPPRPSATAAALLLAALSLPAALRGQAPDPGPWSVQPSAGILFDGYDSGDDGSRAGALVGLQVGRRLSPQVRIVASLAYARVGDVGEHAPGGAGYAVFRNEWVFASLGPAVELPVGRATVTASFQAGAAWRRTPVVGRVGEPGPVPGLVEASGDVSVTSVAVPGLAVRYPLGRRVAVVGAASAYALSVDEGGEVSPAVTLGLSLSR